MSDSTLPLSAPQTVPTPQPRRRLTRRVVVGTLLAFLIAVLLLLRYMGVFGGNVRVVVPGKVYRSAQLTGRNLEEVLTQDHIHTVINLRGGGRQDAWYRNETETCDRMGVGHVDIALSASRLPPPSQLQKLLNAFDSAQYPVLFHCQGGADRSGLAGTLYLHLYQHVPLDEAEAAQLTWRYGHLNFTSTRAMDQFFTMYREDGKGLDMRTWISQRYPQLYAALPASEKSAPTDVPNWQKQ